MSTDGGGEGEVTSTVSTPTSPKNRLKFLCSHGGKILPRPTDGHLKYVGGETRVISVPPDIDFPELMKKLTYLIEGDMVLKYQLIPDELDALVSVKTKDDLRHMFDQCERCGPTTRLRAFLFPANPIIVDAPSVSTDPHALEQRYIDAVNGIVHRPFTKQLTVKLARSPYNLSPAPCSSPRSPETWAAAAADETTNNHHHHQGSGRLGFHRVHSLPSICSLNGQNPNGNHSHHHQNHHHSTRPPVDNHRGGGALTPDRLMMVRSTGRSEGNRYSQVDYIPVQQQCYLTPKQYRGGSECCMHFEDCGSYAADRQAVSTSPSLLSPRHAHNWS